MTLRSTPPERAGAEPVALQCFAVNAGGLPISLHTLGSMEDARIRYSNPITAPRCPRREPPAVHGLPHLLPRRPPAATALLMACGWWGSLLVPSVVAGRSHRESGTLGGRRPSWSSSRPVHDRPSDPDDPGGWSSGGDGEASRRHHAAHHRAEFALLGWSLAGMTVGGRDPARGRPRPDRPGPCGRTCRSARPSKARSTGCGFAPDPPRRGLNDGLAFPSSTCPARRLAGGKPHRWLPNGPLGVFAGVGTLRAGTAGFWQIPRGAPLERCRVGTGRWRLPVSRLRAGGALRGLWLHCRLRGRAGRPPRRGPPRFHQHLQPSAKFHPTCHDRDLLVLPAA